MVSALPASELPPKANWTSRPLEPGVQQGPPNRLRAHFKTADVLVAAEWVNPDPDDRDGRLGHQAFPSDSQGAKAKSG